MVSFIQKTNRNSFTLRFKKYKILRYDFWGRIALANKKNKITNYLKFFAFKDTMQRIKFLPYFKQKRIKYSLNLIRKYKPRIFSSPNNNFGNAKKIGRQKDPILKRRAAIKNLKHSFRFFYGLAFVIKVYVNYYP